jgi:XTP/dITP diphosphohydrolase
MHQKGTEGFGYDPIFIPEESGKTFAQMTLAEKNQYSHRARATAQFLEFLQEKAAL